MEKENKRLKILLGTLSVLAMGLCFYFAYTVYNMGDNDCNSKEISTVTNCVNTNYYNLNVKELSKFGTGDISIIKKEGIFMLRQSKRNLIGLGIMQLNHKIIL